MSECRDLSDGLCERAGESRLSLRSGEAQREEGRHDGLPVGDDRPVQTDLTYLTRDGQGFTVAILDGAALRAHRRHRRTDADGPVVRQNGVAGPARS